MRLSAELHIRVIGMCQSPKSVGCFTSQCSPAIHEHRVFKACLCWEINGLGDRVDIGFDANQVNIWPRPWQIAPSREDGQRQYRSTFQSRWHSLHQQEVVLPAGLYSGIGMSSLEPKKPGASSDLPVCQGLRGQYRPWSDDRLRGQSPGGHASHGTDFRQLRTINSLTSGVFSR